MSKAVKGEITVRPVGRPEKYNPTEIQTICEDFQTYIDNTPDPTVVAFTSNYYKYPVNRSFMTQRDEFSNLVKQAIDKQEAYLVNGATTNKLNATFAIFRLKQPQHGWTDKSEVDNNVTVVSPIVGGMAKAELGEGDEQE